jgi:Arc-like DNA binding domain
MMDMTVEISKETLRALKSRAIANARSLNDEILATLDETLVRDGDLRRGEEHGQKSQEPALPR